MKNSLELVRDFSIDQAKFYLEASKEFYPFGTVLKNDGTKNWNLAKANFILRLSRKINPRISFDKP